MIKKDNFKALLNDLGFKEKSGVFSKSFDKNSYSLKVDFKKQELQYPEAEGFKINERQTCNFKQAENFVVFECVHRLLSQGYQPKHIELEPKWQVGHGASGGRADILIKDNAGKALLIIECKTAGTEFDNAWKSTQVKPTQLFSYVQQERSTKFIALYASDFVDGKTKESYFLINVHDNKKLLENNTKLASYKDANTVDEIYAVWRDTYQKEYATLGLFEDNEAYKIGKSKYSLKDLKTVSSKDIQGKYHEFATIMRQHNVSGRENAFDKLVNLFLCKVVDETNNIEELKFYWKGIAYDDPFSLQDRLNHLYKVGMKKFLGEDITYIQNEQIDDAFSVFKDKPNETKRQIEKFFKELKFFTNNDFAFVDVHNEELFYQNFDVLLKIVKMLQDIKLTGGEDNQFLGDMFEGFLDQGIKQSEGQFFTPMPIVKFIISSLPIDRIKKPKAIDYACGAGHFLNEVANKLPKEQHKNIIGIEKEYRLSKVAKVSSFMYGQDDIKIIYHDALSKQSQVKENDYSILVANPPYSVKGFLETLSEEERDAYELIESVEEKSYTANNAIECFFIERAKQLLKKDGVAGIILPSSILSKGASSATSKNKNIYVQTREILLKYFDIIAIAEFGSGTFGKTGTNTVTLFLRRKSDNPNIAEHLNNMVMCWFEGDFSTNELFTDSDLLANYCRHIEVELKRYKTLLINQYEDKLFEIEMFAEYKTAFNKLTETKNRKKQRLYKAKTKEEKQQIEQQVLLKYIRTIEQDKLYYFCLAYLNPKEVIIVKAPTKNAENKKFLGYEWSGRKGDEGIKYITSGTNIKVEAEDAEVLESILNLKNIQTPLYNPQDSTDNKKINTLIHKNFINEDVEIPEELEAYVSTARLVDMLNFSRNGFSKDISLTLKKKIDVKSRWDLIILNDNCELITKGTTPTSIGFEFVAKGINFVKIESIDDKGSFNKKKFAFISNPCNEKMLRSQLKEGDILFSIAGALGRVAIVSKDILPANTNQALAIIRLKITSNIIIKYLLLVLSTDFIQKQIDDLKVGVAQQNLSLTQIGSFKIPYPPIYIQKKIVTECEAVDEKVEKANSEMTKAIKEIESLFQMTYNKSSQVFKLNSDDFKVSIGKRVLQKEVSEDTSFTPIYSANVFDVFGYINKDILKDFSLPSVIWGIDGDWMVNYIPENTPFYPTDHCGVLRIFTKNLHPRYVSFVLNEKGKEARFSRTIRASIDRIKGLTIEAPDMKTQNEFAINIQKLEEKIRQAQEIIEKAPLQKQKILDKHLK